MHEQIQPVKKIGTKRRRKWPWIVGGLLLIAAIVSAVLPRREKPIEVTFEKVNRRDITQVVSATGKIQPALEVKISAEVAGEIIALPFDEGQLVKKGELIVKIKPDTYQAQVEQQEAALAGARADNLMSKAQLLKANEDLHREQDLFNKKLVSDSDLTAAQTTHDVAEATFNSSTFQIKRAEGQLSQIKEELSKTNIYAPVDGAVSLMNSKLGERVVATAQFAGTEIMRVANLDDMEVQADVNENDVVNVKVGDPVKVSIDSYPNRVFTGRVKHIASTATVKGADTTDEVTNFLVKIQIVDPGVPLRPGMSATADIETATVKNVIAVPIQSVTVRTRDSGKSMDEINKKRDEEQKKAGSSTVDSTKADRENLERVVFQKDGKKALLKKVSTGISDNSYIEIKDGLTGSEEVISGSYGAISRDLKDGSPVELEKPKKDPEHP